MTVGDKRALKNANKVYKVVSERQENDKWYETIKFYDERELHEIEHNALVDASRELNEIERERYKDR